uniref:probable 18S rRNA (guanine-N(7))-methyltransferase isoform X3 n=1 Tax=Agelaius phoeniceus TaxID=39638 RepID=UPI0023EC1CDF|nr:probable 18S rRNA (guanine-N(7))-methyltransferase isoform X3 [Agelaius phoeniceus]
MAGSGRRPEHRGPPELFYDEAEARKYTQNSRVVEIQSQMSERAVELLGLPEDRACLLLDVGCGSGLSGDYISEEGHYWIGMDISPAMLDVAVEREVEGDLLLADVGHGIPFRPGMFDGCISISAVQWLCNADKKSHSPPKRLYRFFSTLYTALLELITAQAMRAGFTGGMVVDYPNSAKAKKFFLCLFVGTSGTLPKDTVQECQGQVCEEKPGLDPGEEGAQTAPGQGGAGRHEIHGAETPSSLLNCSGRCCHGRWHVGASREPPVDGTDGTPHLGT